MNSIRKVGEKVEGRYDVAPHVDQQISLGKRDQGTWILPLSTEVDLLLTSSWCSDIWVDTGTITSYNHIVVRWMFSLSVGNSVVTDYYVISASPKSVPIYLFPERRKSAPKHSRQNKHNANIHLVNPSHQPQREASPTKRSTPGTSLRKAVKTAPQTLCSLSLAPESTSKGAAG